jgi:hypothetical protein
MPKLKIEAELSEEFYRAYEREAKRKGVEMKDLVERTVNGLLEELEHEEEDSSISLTACSPS